MTVQLIKPVLIHIASIHVPYLTFADSTLTAYQLTMLVFVVVKLALLEIHIWVVFLYFIVLVIANALVEVNAPVECAQVS